MSDTTHEFHPHIVPIPVYLAIFVALLVGTGVTIAIAYVDLGPMNTLVAMLIAFFKASLVVLYFMHVKYSSKLVQLAAATGFLWLGIMLFFTLSDVWTRDWQPVPGFAPQFVDEPLGHGPAAAGGHGEATEGHGEAPAAGGEHQ
ncbi:MAG: cytochrome C oxidase subunit IV family protein [Bryobacterales bacterium]